MKTILIVVAFWLFIPYNSYNQSTSQIDALIDHLSWESISLSHLGHNLTPFQSFYEPFVSDLAKIGKPAAERLLRSIGIPEKTVIIHMILTKIFEPEKSYCYPMMDIYRCIYFMKEYKKVVGAHLIYNGLIWELSDGKYSIQNAQIDKITTYWKNKLLNNNNSILFNTDDLLSEIQNMDSKISCIANKTYINNSSSLNFNDVIQLFNISYPAPQYNQVFRILGTDSLVMKSSTYGTININYPADGIEFYIDRDLKLRSIYIKPTYEGTIINGIKMTDYREDVRKKLPNPEEYRGSSYYSYDWYYPESGLHIAFGDSPRIIDILIFKEINNK